MKIILTFFWIAIGAVLLWFFAKNLGQHVNIWFFTRTYEDINLVTVIFLSTLLGVLLGAIIMTLRILKEKARAAGLKREAKRLNKEIEKLNSKLEAVNKELESLKEERARQALDSGSANDTPQTEPEV